MLVVTLTLASGAALPTWRRLPLAADAAAGQSYTLSIQILVLMTLLTLLPAAILSTSAFVRIIIVLSILRQALGTAQTPPNQVLLGIALFLTFFVMSPVISDIHQNAAKPYIDGEIVGRRGPVERAYSRCAISCCDQTRDSDLQLFASIAGRTISRRPNRCRCRSSCRVSW